MTLCNFATDPMDLGDIQVDGFDGRRRGTREGGNKPVSKHQRLAEEV